MNNQIRLAVRGYYDVQQLRIQTGNRLVSHYFNKLGMKAGDKKSKSADEITKQLLQEYSRITDALIDKKKTFNFSSDGLISDFAEYSLVNSYVNLKEDEKKAMVLMSLQVEEHPLWKEFLKDVKGVGTLMAAVIISEIDISKAKYVSSIWKYVGLDVAQDGRGRGRFSEHLVDKQYKDKDGNEKTKKGITYNPFLKAKLLGVLASSFLKSKSPYAEIYYDYKNRLENHPLHKDKTKAHKNNMAKRYMIKQFLKDLYPVWRKLEGLPVFLPYEEAKLGMKHTGTD